MSTYTFTQLPILRYRHIRDDYMLGISEISSSDIYIPFKVHPWYRKTLEHVCSNCFKVIHNFACTETRTCEQCNSNGLPTLTRKLYPSMETLPSRYREIPDVEAYIFPVTRMSSGSSIPADYFDNLMEFVADLSR